MSSIILFAAVRQGWAMARNCCACSVAMAPMGPFFQLGILGATVPALKLDGEIGQQIGYLAAATVGAINFIGLLLVGWAFAHPARVHEIVAKRRRRNRKD